MQEIFLVYKTQLQSKNESGERNIKKKMHQNVNSDQLFMTEF